jgi:ubiquinone/menaquinone biosynthesis C-methylase UbiE
MNFIKLNLGCGDKIIKDYINVDIVNERGGKQPDVICDIRKLSIFENNYSDEIMAIHVVEHFWQWEIKDILKEWIRVLKPDGKLVLECPNLLSACQELINDPLNAAKPNKSGQRSMWVFYGDPSWQDPLMMHKWGYTPQSLAQLMHECGLKNIKQEKAQFKLREPRDMRITGIK